MRGLVVLASVVAGVLWTRFGAVTIFLLGAFFAVMTAASTLWISHKPTKR